MYEGCVHVPPQGHGHRLALSALLLGDYEWPLSVGIFRESHHSFVDDRVRRYRAYGRDLMFLSGHNYDTPSYHVIYERALFMALLTGGTTLRATFMGERCASGVVLM